VSIWNDTVDADVARVHQWDIKAQQFSEALLCILATGSAIMLSTTQQGAAVSLTIYDGDNKVRAYVSDSIELDDWSDKVIGRARKYLDGDSSGS
jgi:hypothetical protein